MFGFFGARYYSKECAESITAFGRKYIQETIDKANKKGFDVIYGDSVDGNTLVIIKKENKIYQAKIESLFDKVDTRNSSGKEYGFLKNVKILSLDKNGNSIFKSAVYVMRHKCNKKMYRVNFTNYWHIDVTEDHSLMGYMRWKEKVRNPLERIVEVKPLEIKKKLKNVISIKKLPYEFFKSKGYPKKVYEFMGYFLGDGSFTRSKSHKKDYYLRLSLGRDREEVFYKLISPLIDIGYIKNFWDSKTRKGDLTVNGLKIVNIISKNCRDSSGKKIIPEWLIHEKEENIASFLRGLFSADGSVMVRSNAPIIKYTSIKDEYIAKVRNLLYRVG